MSFDKKKHRSRKSSSPSIEPFLIQKKRDISSVSLDNTHENQSKKRKSNQGPSDSNTDFETEQDVAPSQSYDAQLQLQEYKLLAQQNQIEILQVSIQKMQQLQDQLYQQHFVNIQEEIQQTEPHSSIKEKPFLSKTEQRRLEQLEIKEEKKLKHQQLMQQQSEQIRQEKLENKEQRKLKHEQHIQQQKEEKEMRAAERKLKHEQSMTSNQATRQQPAQVFQSTDKSEVDYVKPVNLNSLKAADLKKEKILCIDILNFFDYFVNRRDHGSLKEVQKRVETFVNLTKAKGIVIIIFIDDKVKSKEGESKWVSRREKEVREAFKNVPQSTSRIIGEFFAKCGVEVHYSFDRDNDDTLAEYARFLNASILSADRDFYRYGIPFQVYRDFSVMKNQVNFVAQYNPGGTHASKRRLENVLPKTSKSIAVFAAGEDNMMLRGSPSPLTKYLGNPHGKIKGLRQAIYSRLGIHSRIESYPEWDEKKRCVYWVKELVLADEKYAHYLNKPQEAFEIFFKDELNLMNDKNYNHLDKKNHLFACKAVCFELCAIATDQNLVDILMNHGTD